MNIEYLNIQSDEWVSNEILTYTVDITHPRLVCVGSSYFNYTSLVPAWALNKLYPDKLFFLYPNTSSDITVKFHTVVCSKSGLLIQISNFQCAIGSLPFLHDYRLVPASTCISQVTSSVFHAFLLCLFHMHLDCSFLLIVNWRKWSISANLDLAHGLLWSCFLWLWSCDRQSQIAGSLHPLHT